jgi:pyrroloquinoline quinone (PQQ) biosynthesis protein C
MQITNTTPLAGLIEELRSHPVNSNHFFERFRDEYLRQEQLQVWFRQYHYFCKHFVKMLEGLLYATPIDEIEMRVELIKTLHSELGSGSIERAHVQQLERFGLALDLGPSKLHPTEPIPEVKAYLMTLRRLFLESDYLTALGSELAVETTAASEFRYFYPGLKKYPTFTAADLAFFELHVAEEQCHGEWLLEAVRKTATTADKLARVTAGARETADSWHQFWQGIYREVFAGPALHS